MEARLIDPFKFNIDKLHPGELEEEGKEAYRTKWQYEYPDGVMDYPLFAVDDTPYLYGASKYQKEGEPPAPGLDLCIGPRGIRRDPNDPSKFIPPVDPKDPSKVLPGAKVAIRMFEISDMAEKKLADHIKEKKKKDIRILPRVNSPAPDLTDNKKPRQESQSLHAHLSMNKEKTAFTTTCADSQGKPRDIEYFRARSKGAVGKTVICLASAHHKKDRDMTTSNQWRVNHIKVRFWGTDPKVKQQRVYDMSGLETVEEDWSQYEQQQREEAEEDDDDGTVDAPISKGDAGEKEGDATAIPAGEKEGEGTTGKKSVKRVKRSTPAAAESATSPYDEFLGYTG
jgi:hypothetical protein